MHSLEAKIRNESARESRESGMIPGVVYGKDVPSTSIAVGVSSFVKVFREAGKNHVITLQVDKKSYSVLVHEVQRHPVTGAFLHLDFLTVDMKAEVHVQIPVKLVGTSPMVLEGGQIHQSLDALDVKCLPADIVDAFELDIALLDHMGKSLHVGDVKVDTKKFHVLNHAEDAVVSVHAPKKVVEEEVATVAPSDVPVATEKKEEEAAE